MARAKVLLEEHLKALRPPTFLREYDKLARECAAEGADYPRYLLRLSELELLERDRRATERRIKAAKFPVVKTLDSASARLHNRFRNPSSGRRVVEFYSATVVYLCSALDTAARASHFAVRPATRHHEVMAVLRVRKINDRWRCQVYFCPTRPRGPAG